MLAIGLWHGITANFLVFGLCHAVFLVVTVMTAGLVFHTFTLQDTDLRAVTSGNLVFSDSIKIGDETHAVTADIQV